MAHEPDWDAINADLDWRERFSPLPPVPQKPGPKPSTPKKKPKQPKNPGRGLGRGKGRAPSFDTAEAVRLYTEENMPIRYIAERLGVTENPIRNAIKKAGVFNPTRDLGRGSGRKPHEKCGNGHDLDQYGKQLWRKRPDGISIKNGRQCTICFNRVGD